MATVTFIGCGSAFNDDDGNLSAYVTHDCGKISLLDCGFTVPSALSKLGLLMRVNEVFISHLHADHIGGLEPFAQMRYFVGQPQGRIVPGLVVTPDILERLRLLEQLGLGAIQDPFGRPVRATLETYFGVEIANPIEDGYMPFIKGIHYMPVKHVPGDFPSYGFMLVDHGGDGRLSHTFFTADTTEVQHHDWCGLIFHDCQLFQGPNNGAGDVHISMEKLADGMDSALRARTWLMHYGKNWREHEARASELGFAGFVRPGMSFDLSTYKRVA